MTYKKMALELLKCLGTEKFGKLVVMMDSDANDNLLEEMKDLDIYLHPKEYDSDCPAISAKTIIAMKSK